MPVFIQGEGWKLKEHWALLEQKSLGYSYCNNSAVSWFLCEGKGHIIKSWKSLIGGKADCVQRGYWTSQPYGFLSNQGCFILQYTREKEIDWEKSRLARLSSSVLWLKFSARSHTQLMPIPPPPNLSIATVEITVTSQNFI